MAGQIAKAETGEKPMTHQDDTIQQALEIIANRLREPGDLIQSPEAARNYFVLKLAEMEREVFAALLLDTRHRMIEYVELFHGTIDRAMVSPREIAKTVLSSNAAAVIVCHNHPSQDPTPSSADQRLTDQLSELFGLLEVRLVDHIVVGGTKTFSFREHGLL